MEDNAKNEKRGFLFVAAILLVGMNLRAPVTCIGAISDMLCEQLQLSGAAAGLLTTLPLLSFAVFATVSGRLGSFFGLGRSLCLSMLLVVIGVAVRSLCGTAGLFFGTVLAGLGIGVANVLIPVVIKAYYPERIGTMTGAYTTSMSILAGLASAICVPMAESSLGWRGALGVWLIPTLLAFLLWIPRRSLRMPQTDSGRSASHVLRSRVAWYCTLYMGTQAFVYYGFISWMPSILASRGMDASSAGYLISVYQLMGIPANFIAPLLAGKLRDQRILTGGVSALYLGGILLLLFARSKALLWTSVILCGFCTGCAFALCMALIGIRTRSAGDAAGLSGLLQTVGYAIAAVGPFLLGRIFDAVGSWDLPLICLTVIVALNAVCGQLAGKEGYVS